MERRDAFTTEQKAKRKEYHDQYYQTKKEEINAKRRERTIAQRIKKLASREMSETEVKVEVEKVIEEKKKKKEKKEKKIIVGNASKLPRPYMVTSKDADVFGVSTRAFHQKKELFKNCPQGYFQRPEGEDPFKVSFS